MVMLESRQLVRLSPAYAHLRAVPAPPSRLRSSSPDTAAAYRKLYPLLAIRIAPLCPAEGWGERYARDLFERGGFHYPVRWRPHLDEGWRRLTFGEFCVWYGLEPETVLGSAEVACA